MSLSTGEELDHQLDELNNKVELLADYLGVIFDYEWGEVSGVKEKEEK